VDNLSLAETISRIEQLIISGGVHQQVSVNVNKVVLAHQDPALKELINSCAVINADGMPIVWASRMLGKPLKERIAGVDLFYTLVKHSAEKGWGIYFLGAKEQVLDQVIGKIRSMYPGTIIKGFRNGYWKPEEEEGIVRTIREANAQILFVAIPSPKKEEFLNRHLNQLNTPFVMGVGGSFDVFAGNIQRAPLWMQKIGLEWFFRFMMEPHRLFKRYFIDGWCFIFLFFKEICLGFKQSRG
jgi:N-acetylglucosaminyldiphosphoundecaprenol N-acetyl-beta-D-mannosaminyltransferase